MYVILKDMIARAFAFAVTGIAVTISSSRWADSARHLPCPNPIQRNGPI
jgi:hypothetical protein